MFLFSVYNILIKKLRFNHIHYFFVFILQISLKNYIIFKNMTNTIHIYLKKAFSIIKKPNLFFQQRSSFSTIDPKEINTFSKVSDWWDFSGSQQALKAYNYLRTDYIKQILHSEFQIDPSSRYPLKGLEILDVGSGGGLLCEVI